MATDLEIKLYAALSRIAAYDSPEKLHRTAGKRYGLSGNEAIEMAYDNVREEAKAAIKGVRKPRTTQEAGKGADTEGANS